MLALRICDREIADDTDAVPTRVAALRRALGGWLTLARAATSCAPSRHIIDSEPASPWSPPNEDAVAAMAHPQDWISMHLAALASAVRQAARERWPDLAWPLVHRLAAHLFATGQLDLLADLLGAAQQAAIDRDDTAGRACLLRLDAQLRELTDRGDDAVSRASEAASLYQLLGDECGLADCEVTLGFIAFDRGELARAHTLFSRVETVATTVNEPHLMARAWQGLGHCARERGDLASAQDLMRRGVTAVSGGDPFVRAGLLRSLGTTQRAAGDLAAARASLMSAVDLFHSTGDIRRGAYAQTMLADVLCDSAELAWAQELAQAALPVVTACGDRGGIARVRGTLASIAVARGDRVAAREHLETALEIWGELKVPRLARQTRARLEQLGPP